MYLSFVLSTKANASVESVDYSAALQMDGVIGVIDHNDVPADKMFGAIIHDAPVFVIDKVPLLAL